MSLDEFKLKFNQENKNIFKNYTNKKQKIEQSIRINL